jgi:proteasome assembly chaperone (PAC2) family protein
MTLDFLPFEWQIEGMNEQALLIDYLPKLNNPLLIAGFDGWGNALGISKAMVSYIIRKLNAELFAKVNPDLFYRYDENRPTVEIESGTLKKVSSPGASFYAATASPGGKDLVILRSDEPSLRWLQFVDELLSLCKELGVTTIITVGSMYDNVLHTDRIISGIASNDKMLARLKEENVIPINYQGPSAIHSTIHSEGQRRNFQCISLWCHCPYYLQGTTHFGLLAHLGNLLSYLGNFELDVKEMEISWKELNRQIQLLIEKSPEIQEMISELRKAKVRGSWASMKESAKKGDKVISLKDFLESR